MGNLSPTPEKLRASDNIERGLKYTQQVVCMYIKIGYNPPCGFQMVSHDLVLGPDVHGQCSLQCEMDFVVMEAIVPCG